MYQIDPDADDDRITLSLEQDARELCVSDEEIIRPLERHPLNTSARTRSGPRLFFVLDGRKSLAPDQVRGDDVLAVFTPTLIAGSLYLCGEALRLNGTLPD